MGNTRRDFDDETPSRCFPVCEAEESKIFIVTTSIFALVVVVVERSLTFNSILVTKDELQLLLITDEARRLNKRDNEGRRNVCYMITLLKTVMHAKISFENIFCLSTQLVARFIDVSDDFL